MTDTFFSNAAIIASTAKTMLTNDRIRQMFAASTVAGAAQILVDCEYENTTGTSDEIVETERRKTYKKFISLCTDTALAACVTAWHNFLTMPLDPEISYIQAEKNLFNEITKHSEQIKEPSIRKHFTAQLDAFNKKQKVSDHRLSKIIVEDHGNLETMGPLFYWYTTKLSEFRTVKAILMGKRFGLGKERIMESLRVVGAQPTGGV